MKRLRFFAFPLFLFAFLIAFPFIFLSSLTSLLFSQGASGVPKCQSAKVWGDNANGSWFKLANWSMQIAEGQLEGQVFSKF